MFPPMLGRPAPVPFCHVLPARPQRTFQGMAHLQRITPPELRTIDWRAFAEPGRGKVALLIEPARLHAPPAEQRRMTRPAAHCRCSPSSPTPWRRRRSPLRKGASCLRVSRARPSSAARPPPYPAYLRPAPRGRTRRAAGRRHLWRQRQRDLHALRGSGPGGSPPAGPAGKPSSRLRPNPGAV